MVAGTVSADCKEGFIKIIFTIELVPYSDSFMYLVSVDDDTVDELQQNGFVGYTVRLSELLHDKAEPVSKLLVRL